MQLPPSPELSSFSLCGWLWNCWQLAAFLCLRLGHVLLVTLMNIWRRAQVAHGTEGKPHDRDFCMWMDGLTCSPLAPGAPRALARRQGTWCRECEEGGGVKGRLDHLEPPWSWQRRGAAVRGGAPSLAVAGVEEIRHGHPAYHRNTQACLSSIHIASQTFQIVGMAYKRVLQKLLTI